MYLLLLLIIAVVIEIRIGVKLLEIIRIKYFKIKSRNKDEIYVKKNIRSNLNSIYNNKH